MEGGGAGCIAEAAATAAAPAATSAEIQQSQVNELRIQTSERNRTLLLPAPNSNNVIPWTECQTTNVRKQECQKSENNT